MRARSVALMAVALGVGALVGCRGILGAEKAELEEPSLDGGAGQGGAGQGGSAGQSGAAGNAGSAGGIQDAGKDAQLLGPMACKLGDEYPLKVLSNDMLDGSAASFEQIFMLSLDKSTAVVGTNLPDGNGFLSLVEYGEVKWSGILPGKQWIAGMIKHRTDAFTVLTWSRAEADNLIVGTMYTVPATDLVNNLAKIGGDNAGKPFFDQPLHENTKLHLSSTGQGEIVAGMADGTQASIGVYDPGSPGAGLPVTPLKLKNGNYREAQAAMIGKRVIAAAFIDNDLDLFNSMYDSASNTLASSDSQLMPRTSLTLFPRVGALGIFMADLNVDAGEFPDAYFGSILAKDLESFPYQTLAVPPGSLTIGNFGIHVGRNHVLTSSDAWVSIGPTDSDKQHVHHTWLERTGEARAAGELAQPVLTDSVFVSTALNLSPSDAPIATEFHFAWIDKQKSPGTKVTLSFGQIICTPSDTR